MKWLEEHRGEWIALRDRALLDSDRSRMALTERLERAGVLDGTLFVQVDEGAPSGRRWPDRLRRQMVRARS